MTKELYGSKDVCYICDDKPFTKMASPTEKLRLIPVGDYKREIYVHERCAFDAIMEDMRFRNLKKAWRNVFE